MWLILAGWAAWLLWLTIATIVDRLARRAASQPGQPTVAGSPPQSRSTIAWIVAGLVLGASGIVLVVLPLDIEFQLAVVSIGLNLLPMLVMALLIMRFTPRAWSLVQTGRTHRFHRTAWSLIPACLAYGLMSAWVMTGALAGMSNGDITSIFAATWVFTTGLVFGLPAGGYGALIGLALALTIAQQERRTPGGALRSEPVEVHPN